jgi:hypothetical protein
LFVCLFAFASFYPLHSNPRAHSSLLGVTTKQLLLTALFKLSDRLGPECEESIREIIDSFRNDINMELQQRACEYSTLLATDAAKRYAAWHHAFCYYSSFSLLFFPPFLSFFFSISRAFL